MPLVRSATGGSKGSGEDLHEVQSGDAYCAGRGGKFMKERRWFERHRQLWIAEMLNVYGFINREHLQRKFGISVPQASHDLQTFQRENGGAMRYDPSRKCYITPLASERRNRS